MHVNDTWCAIALGSNLGDRQALVENAIHALKELDGLTNLESAPFYETEPVGCPEGAPNFLNTVVEAHYTGDIFDLLDQTQAIERQLGRKRTGVRNEARVIDIDLLLIDGVSVATERLVLPHPRLHERLFVLHPLANLQTELVLPSGDSIADAIKALEQETPLS
jgi:2-amino-4-hydroxy-6-hydroxymethyldihydropteridine diphosphokinase